MNYLTAFIVPFTYTLLALVVLWMVVKAVQKLIKK